jgi:hypothetical protein
VTLGSMKWNFGKVLGTALSGTGGYDSFSFTFLFFCICSCYRATRHLGTGFVASGKIQRKQSMVSQTIRTVHTKSSLDSISPRFSTSLSSFTVGPFKS